MTITLPPPVPPNLPGYTWRDARRADFPQLRSLQIASHGIDGRLDAHALTDFDALFVPDVASATLCAVSRSGQIAAFGSAAVRSRPHEHRAYLDAYAHPDVSEDAVDNFLLEWSEARGRALLSAVPGDRPSTLLIDFTDSRPEAVRLYERRGFRLTLAEDTMRRDLRELIPAADPPRGVRFLPWTHNSASLAYQAYHDAFQSRPGFPGWSRLEWQDAFTGPDTFRPDLSLLAVDGSLVVGYVLCHVETNKATGRNEGWVAQIGVRPAHQGRGIGSALLRTAMRSFQAARLDDVMLDVNVNNPTARRVYERLGFRNVVRRTVYGKPV